MRARATRYGATQPARGSSSRSQTPHWKSPTIIRLALGWSLIRAIAGPSCDRGVDHLCFQQWNFVSKITGVTVLAPKRYPARNCSSLFQRHFRDSARDTRNDIAPRRRLSWRWYENAALARASSLRCRIRDVLEPESRGKRLTLVRARGDRCQIQ